MKKGEINTYILSIIEIAKSVFPNNKLFLLIFFFFKFIGLIILSNAIEYDHDVVLNTYNLFQYFTYYQAANKNYFSYELLCCILYIVLLYPIIGFIILRFYKRKRKHKTKQISSTETKYDNSVFFLNNDIGEIDITFSKKQLILIKANFIIYFIIVFLSQHIIEVLAYVYSEWIRKDINVSNDLLFKSLNGLFIFITNLYVYLFFIIFNSPFLSDAKAFNHKHSRPFLIILMLLFNLQGIHYYPLIERTELCKTIMLSLSGIFIGVMLVLLMRHYTLFNFYYITLISFIFFSLFTFLISLFMETHEISEVALSNGFYIFKYIISLICVFMFIFIWKRVQFIVMNKALSQNIFVRVKNINSNYIYRLIEITKGFSSNFNCISLLYQLIDEHKTKCDQTDECQNTYISINRLYRQLIKSKFEIEYSNDKNYTNTFFDILLFVENEIYNLVYWIMINNKVQSRIEIILLHCNYVFEIMKNINLALFIIEEYSLSIKDMPFKYQIYFNDLKREILQRNKEQSYNKIGKEKTVHVKCVNFLKYYKVICALKKYILITIEDYQYIFYMKNNFIEEKRTAGNNNKINHLQKIFDQSLTLNKSLNKIEQILKDNYYEDKLRNPEVSYLLSNFYTLTSREIPKQMKKYFLHIEYYETVTKFPSFHQEVQFIYPMIFSGNDNKIIFLSKHLSNILGYTQKEVLGKDFHMLLPSLFREQHNLVMRRYLLINQMFNIDKDIFLIDKEKHYYKCHLFSGLLPSLENKLLIINDFDIKNQLTKCFLFILDLETNIISMSNTFEDKFKLTYEMFRKLNVTFNSLFSINTDKLSREFKKKLQSIQSKNLQGLQRIVPIQQSSLHDKLILYYCKREINKNDIKVTKVSSKLTMMSMIQKIKSQIIEHEFDSNWLHNIKLFEDIIREDTRINQSSFFDITIQLHCIGSCGYYYVKVYDQQEEEIFQEEKKTNKFSGTFLDPYCKFHSINVAGRQFKNFRDSEIYMLDTNSKRNIQNTNSTRNQNQSTINSISVNSSASSYINSNSTLSHTNQQLITKGRKSSILSNIKTNKIFTTTPIDNKPKLFNFNIKPTLETPLMIILNCLLAILISLYIYNIFFKRSLFNYIQDLLELNMILVKLRQYIIDSSLHVTSGCLISDGLIPSIIDGVEMSIETIRYLLGSSSSDLFFQLKKLLHFISHYSHHDEIKGLIHVFQKNDNYTMLNADYSISTYESNFETELYYFHYTTNVLNRANTFTKCNVKNFYIDKSDFSLINEKSNFEEQLMYYICNNVPSTFMNQVNSMIVQADHFIMEDYHEELRKTKVFDIALFIIGLVGCILFLWIILIKTGKIRLCFNDFLQNNDKTSNYLKKLIAFKEVILNLEPENCFNYEVLKSNKKLKQKTESTKTRSRKSIVNKKICVFNKVPTEDIETPQGYITFNVFTFHSICSYFFIAILFILTHTSLLITNYFYDIYFFNRILEGKRLSYYYLDRTPSYNEILLYHRVSVLYNDYNFLQIPIKEYQDYLVNFEMDLSNLSLDKDERYSVLGTSMATFLYYRMSLEGKRIKHFEGGSKNRVLNERYKYAVQLKPSSGVCKVISTRYDEKAIDQSPEYNSTTVYDVCMKLSNGISDDGTTPTMTMVYSYLMDEYKDFVREDGKGDVVKNLSSYLYLMTLYQRVFVYNASQVVTSSLITQDIKNLFSEILKEEKIFQILEIIFHIIYITFFYCFILYSLTKKIRVFEKFVKRMNYVTK